MFFALRHLIFMPVAGSHVMTQSKVTPLLFGWNRTEAADACSLSIGALTYTNPMYNIETPGPASPPPKMLANPMYDVEMPAPAIAPPKMLANPVFGNSEDAEDTRIDIPLVWSYPFLV
jgi:hypothetical protein